MKKDTIIDQAIAKIEDQLTPENRADCDKIVVSAMHVALKGGPNSMAAQLAKSNDPVNAAVRGAVNLVLIQRRQTKSGTMPNKAMIPAATILMLKALQFAERSGSLTVDEALVSSATRKLASYVMHSLGLTPDRIKTAAKKVHDIASDPGKMSLIHKAAGASHDETIPSIVDNTGVGDRWYHGGQN